MNDQHELDPQLKQRLEHLKNVPARDPHSAARGRARFLAEAAALQPAPARKARSVPRRRLVWNFAAVALTLLVLFFGGSVGAAFAAQDSLPGETLYPVKLASEDLRLGLTGDTQTEIDLLLQFAAERVSEMNQLAAQGITPPVETAARLESQVSRALQLAAQLGDEEMLPALERIRFQLEQEAQSLSEGGEAGQVLQQTRYMLQEQILVVDEGLADPEQFRNQVQAGQEQTPGSQTTPLPSGTPTPQGSGSGGSGQGGTSTPGGSGGPHTKTPDPQVPDQTPGPTNEQGPQGTPGGGRP